MKFLKQLITEIFTFLKIAILELKVAGIGTTLISLVIPVGIMLMVYFIGGLGNPEVGNQLLSGNLTLVISQVCIVFLASTFNRLKMLGGFEQYAVLPIIRPSFVIATIVFRLLLIIPYIILLFLISVLLLNVKLQLHPLIIPLIFLAAINFSAIGTLIGLSSKNFRKTEGTINIVMFCIMFGSPLFYSMRSLPVFLQIFHLAMPFVYVVDGIKRLIFFSGYSTRLIFDFVALSLFTVVFVSFVSFFFKWKAVE